MKPRWRSAACMRRRRPEELIKDTVQPDRAIRADEPDENLEMLHVRTTKRLAQPRQPPSSRLRLQPL